MTPDCAVPDSQTSGTSASPWSTWPTPPEAHTVGDEGSDVSTRAQQHALLYGLLSPPSSDVDPASGEDYPWHNIIPDENTVVSVSTTFHAAASLLPAPTDLALISSDGIFFHVHTTQLRSVSSNDFNNLIPSDTVRFDGINGIACASDTAMVLNVILHCVYNMSCARYKPKLDTLVSAVDAMPAYGMPVETHVRSLFSLILNQAPMQPLDVYALAARHEIPELAKAVSSHLLSFPLDSFTDDLAGTIKPDYLNRLFLLHIRLVDTLKTLLRAPPTFHSSTPECDFAGQKKLTNAWVLAASSLTWNARADVSPGMIEGTLLSLALHLECEMCQKGLTDRVKDIVARWSMVERTI